MNVILTVFFLLIGSTVFAHSAQLDDLQMEVKNDAEVSISTEKDFFINFLEWSGEKSVSKNFKTIEKSNFEKCEKQRNNLATLNARRVASTEACKVLSRSCKKASTERCLSIVRSKISFRSLQTIFLLKKKFVADSFEKSLRSCEEWVRKSASANSENALWRTCQPSETTDKISNVEALVIGVYTEQTMPESKALAHYLAQAFGEDVVVTQSYTDKISLSYRSPYLSEKVRNPKKQIPNTDPCPSDVAAVLKRLDKKFSHAPTCTRVSVACDFSSQRQCTEHSILTIELKQKSPLININRKTEGADFEEGAKECEKWIADAYQRFPDKIVNGTCGNISRTSEHGDQTSPFGGEIKLLL